MVQSALESPSRRLPPSDTILAHLSLANLLTSLFRTVPIFVSDLGLEVSLSTGWCRVFMLLWMWWRAVGCWMTLTLSVFHLTTLRRQHGNFGPLALQRERRRVWIALGLVWGANLAFSTPALVYSSHVHGNATVELMVISCTPRPLLGCVWKFPSTQQGSAFASASLALNEILPLMLMVFSNLSTLQTLIKHIRAVTSGPGVGGSHGDLDKHVSTERKAAHVIMALVMLFVVCWVLQVAAVTYYNYDGGRHAKTLLTMAHFSASLFVGFSPLVVALGHGKLRRKIKSMIMVWMKVLKCYPEENGDESKSTKTEDKPTVSVVRNDVKVVTLKSNS